MTQYSHFPYPNQYLVLPETVEALDQDATIYIGPSGNDTTGDGSETNPYATLSKAWSIAQKKVILGEATLYITFLKGFYYITNETAFFPLNLYHPQGGNIVIQGDTRAVKQSYLYRVNSYNWDMGTWGHSGHTGSIRLWARGSTGDLTVTGLTGPGTTAHGYTGEDVGLYLAISNPFLSSPLGYYDQQNRIHGHRYGQQYVPHYTLVHNEITRDAYGSLWFGHSPRSTGVVNHGGQLGILGIAEILGATSDPYNLTVGFRNANFDARANTLLGGACGGVSSIGPGVGSPATAYGIANNMPSNLAYDPVGYYGATYGWGTLSTDSPNAGRADFDYMYYTAGATPASYNAATDASVYPSPDSGDTHVTDETLLVTNYPVVLCCRLDSYARNSPISMKGAKLKALQNLFFLDAATDPPLVPRESRTSSYSLLVSGMTQPVFGCSSFFDIVDSELSIRHIGIQCNRVPSYGAPINLVRSTMRAYDIYDGFVPENPIGAEIPNNDHHDVYARLGSMSNTPVLMINSPGGSGIACENSKLNLNLSAFPVEGLYSSGRSERFRFRRRYAQDPVWLQTGQAGIAALRGSRVEIGNAFINSLGQVPWTRISFFLPIWHGMTLHTGISGGVYSDGISYGALSYQYNTENQIMYIRTPTSSGEGVTFARIAWKSADAREWTSNKAQFGSATYTKNGSSDPGPSADSGSGWRIVYFEGVAVGLSGSAGFDATDFRKGVPEAGNTFSIVSYRDNALTIKNSTRLEIGKDRITMHTPSGTTYIASTTGLGSAAVHDADVYGGWGIPCKQPRTPMQGCVYLVDSELTIAKNLILSGGSHGIFATRNSRINTLSYGESVAYPTAYVMCERQSNGSILIGDSSLARLPNLFIKNPPLLNGSLGSQGNAQNASPSSRLASVRVSTNSRLELAGDTIIVSPTKSAKAVFSGLSAGNLALLGTSENSSTDVWNFTPAIFVGTNSELSTTGSGSYRHILLTDGSQYPSGSAVSEAKDVGRHIRAEANSKIGFFFDVPSSAYGNGVSDLRMWKIVGWSGGVAYPLQARQTDPTKRFQNRITQTNSPMWRFWNHPYGVTSSTSTPNTTFFSLPILSGTTATVPYGGSVTIATDGVRTNAGAVINNYGEYVVKPVFGTDGVSMEFVFMDGAAASRTRF